MGPSGEGDSPPPPHRGRDPPGQGPPQGWGSHLGYGTLPGWGIPLGQDPPPPPRKGAPPRVRKGPLGYGTPSPGRGTPPAPMALGLERTQASRLVASGIFSVPGLCGSFQTSVTSRPCPPPAPPCHHCHLHTGHQDPAQGPPGSWQQADGATVPQDPVLGTGLSPGPLPPPPPHPTRGWGHICPQGHSTPRPADGNMSVPRSLAPLGGGGGPGTHICP